MVSIWGERIAAVLCAVFATYMMTLAWNFPAGGNLFPVFSCATILIVCVLMVVRTFVSPQIFEERFHPTITWASFKPVIATGATVIYVLAAFRIGYYTTTFLFFIIFSLAIGVRNFKVLAITVLITIPLMYLFFELFLQARMPAGWFI